MSLELVPKSQLPDWGEIDEQLKNEFEARFLMNAGELHLVSAKTP